MRDRNANEICADGLPDNPKGIAIIQPGVDAQRLRRVNVPKHHQPQRGCITILRPTMQPIQGL
jgi:hypothetical protein